MKRWWWCLSLAVTFSASIAGAQGMGLSISGRRISDGTSTFDVGCDVSQAVLVGSDVIVACTDDTVRTFTRSTTGYSPGDVRVAGGHVSALFVVEGRPWCLVDGAPVAVATLAPPAPVAPPPPEPAAAPEPPVPAEPPTRSAPAPRLASEARARAFENHRGYEFDGEPLEIEITAVRGSIVVLGACSDAGLEVGDRVSMEEDEEAGTGRPSVIGRVTACTRDRGEVSIGFGEVVRVGDELRRTERSVTMVLTDPTPVRSTISVMGGLRAWIDAAGIGTLDELTLTWRADIPFTLRARVFPFAALYVGPTTDAARETATIVGGATLDAFFDHRYVAIGVGVGFGQYTTRFARTLLEPSSDQRLGFTLSPSLRIGTVDGLHLAVSGHIMAVADEFRFGGIDVAGQIPLLSGYWLVPRGGYAPSGLGFAEASLRIAVEGNGPSGTVFLSPVVGWAGIDTGIHGFRSGPMLGLIFETRTGI